MDLPDLNEIGPLLFGLHWQSELARALNVSDRTVRRWLAAGAFPAGVWADLRVLLVTRAKAINVVLKAFP